MGARTPENFVAQGRRREFRLPAGLFSKPSAPHLPNYDNQPATDQAVRRQGMRMADCNHRKRC